MNAEPRNTPGAGKRLPLRVGLIGFGAIGRTVADAMVNGRAGNAKLVAVLCRTPDKHRQAGCPAATAPDILLTDSPDEFLAVPMDLVIEAAGQDALRMFGHQTLAKGIDLMVASIGAFTDDAFYQELIRAAENRDARVMLVSGALPAVDWMAAASLAGVEGVSIRQSKPVSSWKSTPAAEMIDLDRLEEAACFFEGTAREAARRFPKSSNITAMLALATAGLDHTRVQLVADPANARMYTSILFDGPAGRLRIEWHGIPSEKNPSTSADVPLTVIKALRNLTTSVCFAP